MTKVLALIAILGAAGYVLIRIRARLQSGARALGLGSPARPNPDTGTAQDHTAGTGPAPDLARRARELRLSGRRTEAIKLVRSETGMEWDDAERFVRTLR